jgi:glycosyltransferase involved in cell wall biosynthesis
VAEINPAVSIIVPCYNEVGSIGSLLEAIRQQSYPMDRIEVVIADGGSQDGTQDAIRRFGETHPELRLMLVDNPKRTIPAALNTAILQAAGDVVIRLDAHSAPEPDYVARCVETLQRTQAANVGGVWEIQPGQTTWVARSIAAAAAHPLGAGDALYRTGGAEGPAETVPFGAYPRDWLRRVGAFNEALLTNEDYEYNVRIREQGGLVWFNPLIRSRYFARPTLGALAGQYARYGFWKARMLLQHPGSLRWRQALPPLFALSIGGLLVAGFFDPLAFIALQVELGTYLGILVLVAVDQAIRHRSIALLAGFPLALAIMHLSWGGAFWCGFLTGVAGRRG